MLSLLGDSATLGLFGSRNGSARIFCSDADTKEKSIMSWRRSSKNVSQVEGKVIATE